MPRVGAVVLVIAGLATLGQVNITVGDGDVGLSGLGEVQDGPPINPLEGVALAVSWDGSAGERKSVSLETGRPLARQPWTSLCLLGQYYKWCLLNYSNGVARVRAWRKLLTTSQGLLRSLLHLSKWTALLRAVPGWLWFHNFQRVPSST